MKQAKQESNVTHTRLKFSELEFLEDNPRTITEEEFAKLVDSIRKDPTFFDNRQCLVNFKDGRYLVYAGFQRAHAAHSVLGWQEIPCSIEADVPEKTMRERAIRDNTHQGQWDAHVLGNWEFEPEEYSEMGVPEWVYGGGHSANEMTEDDINELEQFDPVGIAADVQRVVFIFDNKGRAEDWLKENVPDLTVKKMNMAWQVNLSTLYT